ncbi:DUF3263 domain-containing protein [Blastococcus sp. SYSU D00813]
MADLTADELLMLQFEQRWWKRAGAKDVEIRNRFGVEPVTYYQRLNALIDRPEAIAQGGLVVGRLRRQRAARGWRVGRQEKPAV